MDTPSDPAPARRLRVDLAGLVDAFDDASPDVSAYLDLETGEVIHVTADSRAELEAIYEEMPEVSPDDEAYQSEFLAALERRNLPDWMGDLLREADLVESGLGTRFIELPEADSRAGFDDLAAFIETGKNQSLRARLDAALGGRGSFRRIREVLDDFPADRERWYAFKNDRVRERVLLWLDAEGIEVLPEIGGAANSP